MEKVRRKSVTMSDVALKAGVSISTVSNVINSSAPISLPTTQKVFDTIKMLGYEPKPRVKIYEGKNTIGIFAPDLSNEFYSRCIQGMFDEAWKSGYSIMICGLEHRTHAEISYIENLLNNSVGGLVFFGGFIDDNYIRHASKKVPVVLCDRASLDHPLDCVLTDNFTAMRNLLRKLAKCGYTRIGYVSEDLYTSIVHDRILGFKTGLSENNLKYYPKMVHMLSELRIDKMNNTNKYFSELLKNKFELPEVYICSSDLIAIGLMHALQQVGLRIPQDIGVIGYDNIAIAQYTSPALTTIAQNMRQIGRSSFQILYDRIKDPKRSPQQITVSAKLIVRDSVKF